MADTPEGERAGFQPSENKTPEALMAQLSLQGRSSELSAAQKAVDFVRLVHGGYNMMTKKDEKGIDGLTGEERETRLEVLRPTYQEYVNALTGPLIDMENAFDRMHNEVPWESRYGEQTFDMVVNLLDNSLRETREVGDSKQKEVEVAFLDEAKATALWAQGLFQILEGSATAIDTYFAGEDQIRQLLTNHIKITETAFEKTFSADLPGLTSSKERLQEIEKDPIEKGKYLTQREMVRKILLKEFSEKENLGNVESVRELALKFQDQRMQIAMMVAEVQQYDPEHEDPLGNNPATKPRERVSMFIDGNHKELIEEIFADIKTVKKDEKIVDIVKKLTYIDQKGASHSVPENILNFYNMEPTEYNERKYKALMQASLALNVLDRLENKINPESPVVLGLEVRTKAQDYLNNYYAEQKFSLRDKLAGVVVGAGIDMDWGLMSCGELGWGWKYEKVGQHGLYGLTVEELNKYRSLKMVQTGEMEINWADLKNEEKMQYLKEHPNELLKDKVKFNGEYVVLRSSTIGSIYSALDVWSPMYVNRHVWEYQANSETTSQMHLGTPDTFRREMVNHRPDWLPPIDKYLDYNPTLKGLLNKLLSGNYAKEEVWDGIKYGELDDRVKKYMNENLNAWPSWAKVNNKDNQYYAIPMFIPSSWLSLNFWRSVGEDGKDAKEVPSLWERFKEGTKLSQVPYLKYKDLAVDWTNVNKSQFARVLMPLFLPHTMTRDIQVEYDKFFPQTPSIDAIKELAKRIRLGLRGEPVDMGVVEVAMIPLLINLHLFRDNNLSSLKVAIEGGAFRDDWVTALAGWANEAANLPETKGLKRNAIKNYGKSIAMLIEFYGSIFIDYAKYASQQSIDKRSQSYYKIRERVLKTK